MKTLFSFIFFLLHCHSCDPSFTTQAGKEEEESKQATADGESDALLGEQKHHGGEQDSEAESCAPHTGEHCLALPPNWPSRPPSP